MWALRFLNGPQAGQIVPLKPGKNLIGRGPNCDVQVKVAGISKEHLEIQVLGSKIVVTDLKSSNGTFVNGVRIQNSLLKLGDKLNLDRLMFDVVRASGAQPQIQHPVSSSMTSAVVPFQTGQPAAYGSPESVPSMMGSSMGPSDVPQNPGPGPAAAMAPNFKEKVDRYLYDVVLPGLYNLVEVFEFRTVMMGFSFVFIFVVTLLSIIPMNQITSESIRTESRRRALTVARALANSNEKAIRSGEMSGYNADLVLRDEGINHVYILGKDGSIIAPPEMVGMTAKDLSGFVSQIKGQIREMSAEISGGQIAASCPILVYDPEQGQNVAKAYAVVVYDTGSLKFDDGRALGLFVQMLAIALIVGAGLFFLMYKLIEYPFRQLHLELDGALREGRDHAELKIRFPLLQQLMVGINSLLTRVQQGGGGPMAAVASTQDNEWMNMLQLFGYPAMLLSKEMHILGVNPSFESLTGTQNHLVRGQVIAYLPDQALQKNIEELVNQAHSNTQQLHIDRLEISGHVFHIQCQAITVANEARYYLIGIAPAEAAEGGAA